MLLPRLAAGGAVPRLVAGLCALAALGAAASGCGQDESTTGTVPPAPPEKVIVQAAGGGFNPVRIYRRAAPGVVTVDAVFGESASPIAPPGAQGSGFVVSKSGEIITNAHVVTEGGESGNGGSIGEARQLFVEFADGNRVEAEIVGLAVDVDLALIKVDPGGLRLRPVPISDRSEFAVGEPVAAIGSPFGENQSLSVGIISATGRTVQSLSQYAIDDAIQTDASINPGNSGGPLLDSRGAVIGINQQIESSSGSSSGVGFAIPVDALRYALSQLREDGTVEYAYIGLTTTTTWPQLAERLKLDSTAIGAALITEVVDGSPAADAGLKGSDEEIEFQGGRVPVGGDVILSIDGTRLTQRTDLPELIAAKRPGQTITLEVLGGNGDRRRVSVKLESRPERPR